jgi:crotonobetainyl-CoA:carnitine CoA-transferase CaiB-like acyl-CoA transferase
MRIPTPDLGQHNDEILRELGYNQGDIADLRAAGAI